MIFFVPSLFLLSIEYRHVQRHRASVGEWTAISLIMSADYSGYGRTDYVSGPPMQDRHSQQYPVPPVASAPQPPYHAQPATQYSDAYGGTPPMGGYTSTEAAEGAPPVRRFSRR